MTLGSVVREVWFGFELPSHQIIHFCNSLHTLYQSACLVKIPPLSCLLAALRDHQAAVTLLWVT